MDEGQELQTLLSASDTFGVLDEALRVNLASAMRRMVVPAGQALVRQGEAGDALFVVAMGQFEVRLLRDDGIETVIDTIGFGDSTPLPLGGDSIEAWSEALLAL